MRNPSDPTQKIVNYARETLEYLKARENFWRSQQPIVRFRPFKDKSARVHKTVGALLFFLSFFVFLFLSFFLLVPTDQLVFFFCFIPSKCLSFLPPPSITGQPKRARTAMPGNRNRAIH